MPLLGNMLGFGALREVHAAETAPSEFITLWRDRRELMRLLPAAVCPRCFLQGR